MMTVERYVKGADGEYTGARLEEAQRLLWDVVVGYDQGGREMTARFIERVREFLDQD